MILRQLGTTGLILSPITLGTVKFGRNQSVKYPTAFDLPPDKDIQSLLSYAHELGVNTLDTAPAYGISEQRLGELIDNRDLWQIVSKAGEIYDNAKDTSYYDYSPKSLEQQLDNSLRQLKTDYLDCWLLHSDGNDIQNLNDDVLAVFQKAKRDGKVRTIGASTKTVEGGKRALENMDCIMMTASLNYQDENSLFDTAGNLGKGILLKKVFDSGWALTHDNKAQIMQDTFSSVFQHDACCSAVIGTTKPEHLKQNIDAYMKAVEA